MIDMLYIEGYLSIWDPGEGDIEDEDYRAWLFDLNALPRLLSQTENFKSVRRAAGFNRTEKSLVFKIKGVITDKTSLVKHAWNGIEIRITLEDLLRERYGCRDLREDFLRALVTSYVHFHTATMTEDRNEVVYRFINHIHPELIGPSPEATIERLMRRSPAA